MGRKRLSRITRLKRRFSLGSLVLIAILISGTVAASSWFLVGRDYQTGTVQEVCQITPHETRTLDETLLPGATVGVWYLLEPINDYPNPLIVKIEATVQGIAVDKWEIKPNSEWVAYSLGDNITLSDYSGGLELSLSGSVMGLENQNIDNVASITVELYRMT